MVLFCIRYWFLNLHLLGIPVLMKLPFLLKYHYSPIWCSKRFPNIILYFRSLWYMAARRRRRRQNFVCGGAYPPFSSSSIKSWFGGACYIRNWWWSDPVFDFYQVQKIPISFQKSRETTARRKGGSQNSQNSPKKASLHSTRKKGWLLASSKIYQEVFQKNLV